MLSFFSLFEIPNPNRNPDPNPSPNPNQVDLGPFKHTVDDGLELRKAAFECMDTLLDGCPDRLELAQFLVHLIDGLKDDHDIKVLCHIMLRKLAAAPNGAAVVVASLDPEP